MNQPSSASQTNAARFNEIAESWDENPTRTALAEAVARAILSTVQPTGKEKAMEFGCGTGLVTAMTADALGHVVAADNSEGMLEVLKRKTEALNLTNVEAVQIDISSSLPNRAFDLIFSSMSLHHILDVAGLFARLAGILKPGGRIAVADLEKEDGSFHGDVEGIMHHGFDLKQIAGWLTAAGLEDVHTSRIHVVHKTGTDDRERDYPVFLATARKPT